jgi:hypothetical protein
MAGLEKRLERVQAERKMGEARLARQALTYLSNEDLEALEDVFVVGWEKAGERERRALEAINETLDTLREGGEPQKGETR